MRRALASAVATTMRRAVVTRSGGARASAAASPIGLPSTPGPARAVQAAAPLRAAAGGVLASGPPVGSWVAAAPPPPPSTYLHPPPPLGPGTLAAARRGLRTHSRAAGAVPVAAVSSSGGEDAGAGEEAGMAGKRIFLIDGTALLYRAHYAFSASGTALTSAAGEDTTIAVGFVNTLIRLLEVTPPPTHIAVAFDVPGKTFRHALFPEYKGHRPPTPPSISAAAPRIRHLLRALGIADLAAPGVEADDLIGTLAARGAAAGAAVAIVSPDRDFFQLLGPGVQVLRPPGPHRKTKDNSHTALTVAGLVPYTASDWAAETGGLSPAQAVDVKALQGDPSDNVPGVPGVGAVWAARLVREHGSVEGVLGAAAGISRPGLRAALSSPEGRAQASLAKRLVTINTSLDIPPARLPWDDLAWGAPCPGPAREGARAALAALELVGAAARLDALWATADAVAGVMAAVEGGGGGGGVPSSSPPIAGLMTGAELAAARERKQGEGRA